MPSYQPVYQPIRLLIRNDDDTGWDARGPQCDDLTDVSQYVRQARLTRTRKRIVHVTEIDRPIMGMPRYRLTTVWEGTVLPAWFARTHPAADPDYPRNYDNRNR
ncbi:hypothetical protein [Nocardia jejuensis]|uniref:hypothetical protein n=1 Tax=Nocardia jejuensis TaxID=328049 RepID=UPI000837649D|nr:hypothetical protein [Nocardia jejuensis]